MFLTLEGKDVLKLEGANQFAIDSIIEQMSQLWEHYGTTADSARPSLIWRMRFGGNPWAATGKDGLLCVL